MSVDLMLTKLYIPSIRANLVHRPRLIQKLIEGRGRKLFLVSAPAGYGKTTLITEWLDHIQTEDTVCWLSLDEDDSQPQQFFRYLAETIRPLPNAQSSLMQRLQSPQPLPAKNLMTAFVNDVTPVATPFYLILDDYHAIESADIDKSMAFLLDHMPPQMTLVLTSRSDPGFPISRLRARGELIELRANDLRFTETEAAQFLQQGMNLTLSPDQIAALEKRTEGWIAGLQMAALSMQNRDDLAGFIDSFKGSHRYIMDYLLEEVLDQQSAEVQVFLLETAVLDRLCADLCDAVRQSCRPPSQQILEQLENHNLFLIPLDNERRWYRYHHLFADLLRQRLQQQQPELVPQLHQRASDWYAANGRSADAIRHALAANDFDRAAGHIEQIWRTMLTHQLMPWRQWLDALPDSVIQRRPVLNVGYAWAHLLFDTELDACEQRLQEAEAWLNLSEAEREARGMVVEDDEEFEKLPATIASVRTYAARAAGDTVGAVNHARQALNLLPEDDHLGRALPAALLGLCYWTNGELSSAYETVSYASNSFHRSGDAVADISLKLIQVDILLVQGRLHDARRTCEQALKLYASDLWGASNLFLSLSEIYREQGEWKTATDTLQQSVSLGKQTASFYYRYRNRVALADIEASQGAFDKALDYLDETEPWWGGQHLRETRPLAAIKARVWLKQGRLNEALDWVKKQGLSIDDELSYLHEFEHVTLARIRIAQYQNGLGDDAIHQAIRLLARLLQAAEAGKRNGSIIEILILQALAHEAQNNISAALLPANKSAHAGQAGKLRSHLCG